MRFEKVQDWLREFQPDRFGRKPDEREFLPAALEIMETPPSPLGRITALCIAAVTVIAFLWACLGKIDVIATAPGKIAPVGNTKIIQPMEIGVVRAIHVSDGDSVRVGQVLIEIDPVQAKAERDKYADNLKHALLNLAELEGLWNALKSKVPPRLVNPLSNASDLDIAMAESAMRARHDEGQATLGGLDQQIAQKSAEVAAATNSILKLQESLPYVQEQADLRSELMKLQFSNKLAYLQSEQVLVEQKRQILVLQSEKAQAVAEKAALIHKRQEAASNYEKTLLEDLDKAKAQASEFTAGFTKTQDTLKDKTLRAPISGTVQELAVHTIGGVVTPAQPLMIVVPNKGTLIVEAMVNNRDVGFVHIGQTAEVKVDTFSFTRYGLIEGKVIGLNHDTVTPPSANGATKHASDSEENQTASATPSYVARIQLTRNWMDTESGHIALGPGMTVTAEIHTGRRRIISYLLSPLQAEMSESMHER